MLKNNIQKNKQIKEVYYIISLIICEICNSTNDVLIIQSITNFLRFYLAKCKEMIIEK